MNVKILSKEKIRYDTNCEHEKKSLLNYFILIRSNSLIELL